MVARGVVMRWFCEPLISIGFPMLKIAFLPIFILWFGVYDFSKIVMVAFASVFTIAAAADVGMRGVDRFLTWSARSMGCGPSSCSSTSCCPPPCRGSSPGCRSPCRWR